MTFLNNQSISPAPETGSEFQTESLKTSDVLMMFRRRIWTILVMTLLALGAAVAYIKTTPPLYESTASVLIDARMNNSINGGEVLSNLSADSPVVDTQVAIIRSDTMALRVIKNLQLMQDPVFRSMMGLEGQGSPDEPITSVAISTLKSMVRIQRETTTALIETSARSTSAEFSARVANAFAESFVKLDLETKYDATRQTNVWLKERLAVLQEEVKKSDAEVDAYRTAHGLVSTQGSTVAEAQLSNLNRSLSEARADLAEKLARFETTRQALESGGSIESVPEVMRSPVVTQLRAQISEVTRRQAELGSTLGYRHPEMVKVSNELRNLQGELTAEANRILSTLKADVDFAGRRVASLNANLKEWEARLGKESNATIKLKELERNANANRQLYESFLAQFKQTNESASSEQTSVRVVSPALPAPYPSWPRKPLIYVLAGVIGAALGVFLALGLEVLETGFVSVEAVHRDLGIPVLTSIRRLGSAGKFTPEERAADRAARLEQRKRLRQLNSGVPIESIAGSSASAESPGKSLGARIDTAAKKPSSATHTAPTRTLPQYIVHRPMSTIAENLRALGTIILAQPSRKSGSVVLITSSLSGEGKTSVVLGLARVLAKTNFRVLAVDMDMRKATLTSEVFGEHLDGVEAGLKDPDGALSCIRADPLSEAMILPSQIADSETVKLLSQESLTRLLDRVRNDYDLILVDAPPVSAVADTLTIARSVDVVLMVVEWRATSRQLVRMTRDSLARVGASISGIILTKAPDRNQAAYGPGFTQYSKKYGYVKD